jgi:hypothetical protein
MVARKGGAYLPTHVNADPKSKIQVTALLGHCLYRRVVICSIVVILLLVGILYQPGLTEQSRNVLHLVHGSKGVIAEVTNIVEPIPLQIQESVGNDLPKQEDTHEIKVDIEVDVAKEDAKDDIPNMEDTIKEDTAKEDATKEDIAKEEVVKDDTSRQEEKPNGPKWLDYKQ